MGVRDAGAAKPPSLTFEQAAPVPTAGITTLLALRDRGKRQPGQHVLLNGASGGVGTFAVQIARAFGAEATGVCGPRNAGRVRFLGADRVVDYTREAFTRSGRRYDPSLDVAGSRSWSECKRVLYPAARRVIVGGPKPNRWIGPISHVLKVRLATLGVSQKVVFFVANFNRADFAVLHELLASGKLTPVIDRTYPLS